MTEGAHDSCHTRGHDSGHSRMHDSRQDIVFRHRSWTQLQEPAKTLSQAQSVASKLSVKQLIALQLTSLHCLASYRGNTSCRIPIGSSKSCPSGEQSTQSFNCRHSMLTILSALMHQGTWHLPNQRHATACWHLSKRQLDCFTWLLPADWLQLITCSYDREIHWA